jgi:hypothetical protein
MDHCVEIERRDVSYPKIHQPQRARRSRKARRYLEENKKEQERLAAVVLIHQKTDSKRKKGKGEQDL